MHSKRFWLILQIHKYKINIKTTSLYLEKLKNDEACRAAGRAALDLPQFAYYHLARTYEREDLADLHATQLQLAVCGLSREDLPPTHTHTHLHAHL